MNIDNKTLSIEDMSRMSIEQTIDLYRQGYTLAPQSELSTQPVMQDLQTSTTTDGTTILLFLGVIVVGAIIYFKWWLPTRYELEAAAARHAGVEYKAVGLTGAGRGY